MLEQRRSGMPFYSVSVNYALNNAKVHFSYRGSDSTR